MSGPEIHVLGLSQRLSDRPTEADPVTTRLYEDLLPGTVQIYAGRVTGSGFSIDNHNHVVTDVHVALGGRELQVVTPSGTVLPATIDKIDGLHDIAILNVPGLEKAGVKPMAADSSGRPVMDGEPIYALGHPLGDESVFISPGTHAGYVPLSDVLPRDSQAVVQSVPRQFQQEAQQLLNRPLGYGQINLLPGDSGGPVVDSHGKVVGVSDLSAVDGLHGFFTPAKTYEDLLKAPSRYRFKYSYQPESWVADYEHHAKSGNGLGLALGTLGVGFLGSAAYRWLPRVVGPLAATAGVVDGMAMWNQLDAAGDSRSRLHYGAGLLADVGVVAGGVLSVFPETRPFAGRLLLGSVLGRLGADAIPYRPVLQDLQAHNRADMLFPCLIGSAAGCTGDLKFDRKHQIFNR